MHGKITAVVYQLMQQSGIAVTSIGSIHSSTIPVSTTSIFRSDMNFFINWVPRGTQLYTVHLGESQNVYKSGILDTTFNQS